MPGIYLYKNIEIGFQKTEYNVRYYYIVILLNFCGKNN